MRCTSQIWTVQAHWFWRPLADSELGYGVNAPSSAGEGRGTAAHWLLGWARRPARRVRGRQHQGAQAEQASLGPGTSCARADWWELAPEQPGCHWPMKTPTWPTLLLRARPNSELGYGQLAEEPTCCEPGLAASHDAGRRCASVGCRQIPRSSVLRQPQRQIRPAAGHAHKQSDRGGHECLPASLEHPMPGPCCCRRRPSAGAGQRGCDLWCRRSIYTLYNRTCRCYWGAPHCYSRVCKDSDWTSNGE